MADAPIHDATSSTCPPTNPSLLGHLPEGDQDAWFAFERIYAPLIRRCARKVGVRCADDVVQKVMLSFHKALVNGSFEYDQAKGKLRSYLATCAKREAFRELRERHYELEVDPACDLAEQWRRLEREEVLRYELEQLETRGEVSQRDLDVFRRRKLQCEATDAIAENYQISSSRVHVIVHEVKAKLAARLKAHYEWPA